MNHALPLAKAIIIPLPMLAGCSGGTPDAIDKIIQSSTTMALTVSGFGDDQVYDLSSISPLITAINSPGLSDSEPEVYVNASPWI